MANEIARDSALCAKDIGLSIVGDFPAKGKSTEGFFAPLPPASLAPSRLLLKSPCQASVPRDVFPPTPPGPEGSNGNGLLRVQRVPGAWLSAWPSALLICGCLALCISQFF